MIPPGLYLKNRRQPKSLDPTPAGTPSPGLTGGAGAPGLTASSSTHWPVTASTANASSHWTQLAAAAGQHLHEAVAANSNGRGHPTPHGPVSPRAATASSSEKNVGHLALPELPGLPTPPIATTEGSPAVAAAAAVASRDNADPPAGSCPGGGVCNGSGGQTCCQGCPAFNNRVMYRTGPGGNAYKKGKKRAESEAAQSGGSDGAAAKGPLGSTSSTSTGVSSQLQSGSGNGRMIKVASTGAAERDSAVDAADGGEASNVGVMECHNCGTRTLTCSLIGRLGSPCMTDMAVLRCRNHAAVAPRRRRPCRLQRLWSVPLFLPLGGISPSSCLTPEPSGTSSCAETSTACELEGRRGGARLGLHSGRSPNPANLMGFRLFFRRRRFNPSSSERVTLARHTDSSLPFIVFALRPAPFVPFAAPSITFSVLQLGLFSLDQVYTTSCTVSTVPST